MTLVYTVFQTSVFQRESYVVFDIRLIVEDLFIGKYNSIEETNLIGNIYIRNNSKSITSV